MPSITIRPAADLDIPAMVDLRAANGKPPPIGIPASPHICVENYLHKGLCPRVPPSLPPTPIPASSVSSPATSPSVSPATPSLNGSTSPNPTAAKASPPS